MLPYNYSERLRKILKKLYKKEKLTYERVIKKIKEVSSSGDIEHYKNLRYPYSKPLRAQK